MPLGNHDAFIAGDTITTLHINSEWRKFLSHAIGFYLEIGLRRASPSELDDIEPLIGQLFDDFYSADGVVTGMVGAKVRRTTNQTILTATGENYASFDTEDFDTDGFWVISNPTKLIVPSGLDGLYLVEGSGLNSNLAGNRTMSLWNNSSREARLQEIAETLTQGVLSTTLQLVAGDEIRLSFTSSTNSTLIASANDSPWLSLVRLSE